MSEILVCIKCLEDDGLKVLAEKYLRQGTCRYCGKSDGSEGAVPLSRIVAAMRRRLSVEWCKPADYEFSSVNMEGFLEGVRDSKGLFKWINFSVSNPALMSEFEQ